MATLKNHRKINSGRIYSDYFKAEIFKLEIDFKGPFGDSSKDYLKSMDCFVSGSQIYAIRDIDHFNGHLSGWQNPSAVFSIKIAMVDFGVHGSLKKAAIINSYKN